MARALFSESLEGAISALSKQFHYIRVSAEAMADDDGNDREFSKEIRNDLYGMEASAHPNKMNTAIKEQVELIENVLLPILRLNK